MNDAMNSIMPIGAVIAFGGDVDRIPEGWLLCDGSAYHRDTQPELFKVIAGAFGLDGVNFHVPDLRGRWIRGVSAESNRDPAAESREAMNPGGNSGNTVGSVQNAGGGLHEVESRLETGARKITMPANGGWSDWVETGGQNAFVQTSTRFRNVGEETRVNNAYLHYIIRAQ